MVKIEEKRIIVLIAYSLIVYLLYIMLHHTYCQMLNCNLRMFLFVAIVASTPSSLIEFPNVSLMLTYYEL